MPKRDPNTGQYVSSDAVSGEITFDDLDLQQVSLKGTESAAHNDGTTGQFGGQSQLYTNLETFEPAGGLSRGEVAMLVYSDWTTTAYVNSTATADGTYRVLSEVSADPARTIVTGIDSAGGGYESFAADSGTSSLDVHRVTATDPDVLAVMQTVAHSPITDGAAGVGGAGQSTSDSVDRHYLEEVGSGPTYDRHNDLQVHAGTTQWNVADNATHFDISGELAWYVFEE